MFALKLKDLPLRFMVLISFGFELVRFNYIVKIISQI